MSVPVSELQAIAPSAIIELFELQLNVAIQGVSTLYRFHAGVNLTGSNGDVVWAGNAYAKFPIEAEGFEYSGNGQLPRPKIRVSNILGTITAIILATPLEGAKVTRIRTMARYLDAVNFPGGVNPLGTPDPTSEWPREVYFIDRKSAETRDVVEYELAAAFDLAGVRAPKRQCISNICQWVYRSAECGYTEASYYDENDAGVASAGLDVCGKRLSSCKVRFGSIARTGAVTVGSTAATVSSTAGLIAGLPISGFGVPTGATISSISSGTALVMSAAATLSTNTTVAGTPSATAASMTVTSAAGLAAGLPVTGQYIPAGTTIASISGTALTLNQRPYSFTRAGSYTASNTNVITISTSGISVGMRVFGSNSINTTVTAVGSGTITLANKGTLPNPTTSTGRPGLGLISNAPTAIAVTLYFIPASPASSSYTFTGNNQFTFRAKDAVLPFGSFPGVGAYFT